MGEKKKSMFHIRNTLFLEVQLRRLDQPPGRAPTRLGVFGFFSDGSSVGFGINREGEIICSGVGSVPQLLVE